MELDPYAALADRFLSGYATLRGAVRYHVLGRQVDAHLGPPPLRIIDVGGGAGHQAIRLARAGHRVVLLDPSEEMLRRAQLALDAEDGGVRDRVGLVHGWGEEAPEVAGEGFDAVLCHGVLPYLDDPGPLLGALAQLAVDGGVVSVLAKNASALAMRAGLEGRFGDALRTFGAERDPGGLGVVTRGDMVEQLSSALAAHGVQPVAWYGLRVFTDHRRDLPVPGDPAELRDVLEAEWLAGCTDPYRWVARLLHVVGRRGDLRVSEGEEP